MTRISADWVAAPASRAVMDALGDGYFVGGCVRNALLGVPVADIDIATPLVPNDVIKSLDAARIKAIPTGISHGTITAVHHGNVVEVTTFRADVETDGRHATVAFTTDMAIDAGRRDFTMNALYADRNGVVIDPLGGLADLAARRVRFIGSPHDRIREDYLRILRFFRFHAWYGRDGIDPDGLAACAELADGLDKLARERIGWEFRKLLSAPDPGPAIASMQASGVLWRCLPGADPSGLGPLVHLEQCASISPDWHTRLMVLGGEEQVKRLRLSKAEAARLARIGQALEAQHPIAEAAYRWGPDSARSAALITSASFGSALPDTLDIELERGGSAFYPLAARDLLALGYEPGPVLGAELSRLEAVWISSDFSLDRAALVEKVRNVRS